MQMEKMIGGAGIPIDFHGTLLARVGGNSHSTNLNLSGSRRNSTCTITRVIL